MYIHVYIHIYTYSIWLRAKTLVPAHGRGLALCAGSLRRACTMCKNGVPLRRPSAPTRCGDDDDSDDDNDDIM